MKNNTNNKGTTTTNTTKTTKKSAAGRYTYIRKGPNIQKVTDNRSGHTFYLVRKYKGANKWVSITFSKYKDARKARTLISETLKTR